MKKLHHHVIFHLRAYRTCYFMFFTFLLAIVSFISFYVWNSSYAEDLLEQAFSPAMNQETIINLWAGKNAVGNEVLREWVRVQDNLGIGCFVNNEHLSQDQLSVQKIVFSGSHLSDRDFCENVLGGDYNTQILKAEAPLIVRITKFLLRITMVLAVTMVIFNGVMWIIESAKWGDVKNAQKNIILIVVGILIALLSLSIVNLISSVTISSLDGWNNTTLYNPQNISWTTNENTQM